MRRRNRGLFAHCTEPFDGSPALWKAVMLRSRLESEQH